MAVREFTTEPKHAAPNLPASAPVSFERQLKADLRWALSEGSQFFEGKGSVQETLHRVTRRLAELNIPYAVCGGLALFAHGYRRFTEDVDILVTQDGLERAHKALDGLGYVPPFSGSQNLRDAESRVKIEFLVTGAYPGDGKPKPVAFPDPAAVAVELDGVQYLNLVTLVELKLASGMTDLGRLRDLSDVLELIRLLNLSPTFVDDLSPFVREKYVELWKAAR